MSPKANENMKRLAFLGIVAGFKAVFQQASGVEYAKAAIRGDSGGGEVIAGLEGLDALAGKREVAIRLD